jgi:hypothetical protein
LLGATCLFPGVLQLATDAQGQLVELGAGAFAVVYLGRLQGSPVAVKVSRQNRGFACRLLITLVCGQFRPAPLADALATWVASFARCLPPAPLQVIKLLPGMDSHTVGREAALLRDCTHERIVPLYGVALKVGAAACTAFTSLHTIELTSTACLAQFCAHCAMFTLRHLPHCAA